MKMKAKTIISGKKRRAAILAARLQREARRLAAAQRPTGALRPASSAPVATELLALQATCGDPEFVRRGYYSDLVFRCADCGIEGVWTAARQKWWYEVAGGDLRSSARRCAQCRARERERKAAARQTQSAARRVKVAPATAS